MLKSKLFNVLAVGPYTLGVTTIAILLMFWGPNIALSDNSDAPSPKVIAEDRRFVAYDNDTVLDTNTGLIWASRDNGEDIRWKDAKQYCDNYQGGGHTDWRMPTKNELLALFDKSISHKAEQKNYEIHMTNLIHLTTCCVWSSDTRGSNAAVYNFKGDHGLYKFQNVSTSIRALPVRNGNWTYIWFKVCLTFWWHLQPINRSGQPVIPSIRLLWTVFWKSCVFELSTLRKWPEIEMTAHLDYRKKSP